jgi:hypothetical protein
MGIIPARFTRVRQRWAGYLCMHFLLIFQEVGQVSKTCNQLKGKSNCPAQFGRKPGITSEPASGFIFATLVPHGNPSDPSYGLPLLDKVQRAIDLVQTGGRRRIYSVASDPGLNDPVLRQALHDRGILTVGIPKTVEPIVVNPDAHDAFTILKEAGLHRLPYC